MKGFAEFEFDLAGALLSQVVNQNQDKTLFAAVFDGTGLTGVFRSLDKGAQWMAQTTECPPWLRKANRRPAERRRR